MRSESEADKEMFSVGTVSEIDFANSSVNPASLAKVNTSWMTEVCVLKWTLPINCLQQYSTQKRFHETENASQD